MKKRILIILTASIIISSAISSISTTAANVDNEQKIEVNNGGSGTPIVIYGHVYNENTGEPIKRAVIIGNLDDIFYWGSALTDSNGEYKIVSTKGFGDLPYEIWLEVHKFGYSGWFWLTPNYVVKVKPGDIVEVDLYVKPWINNVQYTQSCQQSISSYQSNILITQQSLSSTTTSTSTPVTTTTTTKTTATTSR